MNSKCTEHQNHPRLCHDSMNTNVGQLPEHYSPSDYDVICGRGKPFYRHTGNRRFRLIVAIHLEPYIKALTMLDKSLLVISIVDSLRARNGAFVKWDRNANRWLDIGNKLAREKVGHALRDAIHSQEREFKMTKEKPCPFAVIEKAKAQLLELDREVAAKNKGHDMMLLSYARPEPHSVAIDTHSTDFCQNLESDSCCHLVEATHPLVNACQECEKFLNREGTKRLSVTRNIESISYQLPTASKERYNSGDEDEFDSFVDLSNSNESVCCADDPIEPLHLDDKTNHGVNNCVNDRSLHFFLVEAFGESWQKGVQPGPHKQDAL